MFVPTERGNSMSDLEAVDGLTAQDVHVCLFAIETILAEVKSIPAEAIFTPEQQAYLDHLKVARINLLGLKCEFICPTRRKKEAIA